MIKPDGAQRGLVYEWMNNRGQRPEVWLSSCGSQGSMEKMEQVFAQMKMDKGCHPNWTTYSTMATVYIKQGQIEKAEECLRMVEGKIAGRNRIPYHYLISLYGSVGNRNELFRIWNIYKETFSTISNTGYRAMVSSLVRMGDIDGAEEMLQQWLTVRATYDPRVPNLLMQWYVTNGQLNKATEHLDNMTEAGGVPNSNTWEIIAEGYVGERRIPEAISCLKNAFHAEGASSWKPKPALLTAFINLCEEENDTATKEVLADLLRQKKDLENKCRSEGVEDEDDFDGGDMQIASKEDFEESTENGGEMIGRLDDDSEEDKENDGEMNVVSDEDSEEGKDNDLVYGEMEELEKEYTNLRQQEQDVLANLRQQKGEDYLKGVAVKNQKTLWNKSLELRFLLQKPFSSSNRLPQELVRSLFIQSDEGVSEAYSELISSSEKTIDLLLELQNVLLENNPFITQFVNGNSQSLKKQEHEDIDSEIDHKWKLISQMHSRMASFRDKSIDKWQRKTQVTTGAASIKGRFQAFNQNISQQVVASMRDPSRLIEQMQVKRSTISIFGSVPDEIVNIKEEGADGNPDILDDVELYQQLLKEFFETFDPSSTEAVLYNFKRSQAKKRKIVDRRASKSRKIRYNVHKKIVNFMAPESANIFPMASKLFKNLFGSKTPACT